MFSKNPKKIIFILLIAFFFSSSSFFLTPQKAEGQWYVFDGANAALNAISNAYSAITSFMTKSLAIKETVLDGIAFVIINGLIEKIADSTVDWINSGFDNGTGEGGPMFITDFGGFLTDVGDQTLGDFIAGSPLAFLCSPFSLDIKIALTLQFGGEREARCTLTDVFENADNALDDLGNNWSWSKWNNISQTQNNAYGAYSSAYADLTLRLAEEEDRAIVKSDWGGGFLEFQSCEDDKEATECDDVMEEGRCETYMVPGRCSTKTPGSLIQDTLGDTLMLGNDRLVIADEINEIVGALLNQLFKAVLGGIKGEGGLFDSNPGGDNDENFTKLPADTVDKMKELINDALGIEQNYKGWKEKSWNIADLAERYLEALITCWETDMIITETERQTKISAAQSIINNQITPLKTTLNTDIGVADTNILILNDLIDKIDAATDDEGKADPVVINNIWKEFNNLVLHTVVDPTYAEQEFHGPPTEDGIESKMNAIINKALLDKEECGGTFTVPPYTPSAPTCIIGAIPDSINQGGSSIIGWTSTNATSGFINNGIGSTTPVSEGSATVTPSTTTTYTGTFTGMGGTTICPSTTITVTP